MLRERGRCCRGLPLGIFGSRHWRRRRGCHYSCFVRWSANTVRRVMDGKYNRHVSEVPPAWNCNAGCGADRQSMAAVAPALLVHNLCIIVSLEVVAVGTWV